MSAAPFSLTGMKHQITRLSPHQNGKVIGVLMALGSLFVLVPLLLVIVAAAPPGVQRPPLSLILLAPVFYLVISYAMVALGCAIYNLVARLTGGFEFETRDDA